MSNVIFIILFPLIGFFGLSFSQGKLSRFISGVIGIGSVISSLICVYYILLMSMHYKQNIFFQYLFLIFDIEYLKINFNLVVDKLSLSMLVLVSCIGLLVHVYSYWYMRFDSSISRFFSYLNFFMASMFLLVLSNNLLCMFYGWELVGVCSYLLISFYYKEKRNLQSSTKAFLITRIGDIFFVLGIFVLYIQFGTVDFKELQFLVDNNLFKDIRWIELSTLFLLIGAISKSVQVPLQTWLSDAMVGPTPASALIHSATMVAAGVYLIIRMNFIFSISPIVLYILGCLGSITILISSISALFQTDIKKILAYSTMSQLGYMYLALSACAWNAAIMHLISHAVFKSLLFLSSASIMYFHNNTKSIFSISGIKWKFPFIYYCLLIGGASLSSFPVITSGFYTKGEILYSLFKHQEYMFLCIAMVCTFLTSLYIFRMIFLISYGKEQSRLKSNYHMNFFHTTPLLILLIFSTFLIIFIMPSIFSEISDNKNIFFKKFFLELISGSLSVLGIIISYYKYVKHENIGIDALKFNFSSEMLFFIKNNFGFDYLYDFIFKNVYFFFVNLVSKDPVGKIFNFILLITIFFNKLFSLLINGYLRWYVTTMTLGLVFFLLSFFSILLI